MLHEESWLDLISKVTNVGKKKDRKNKKKVHSIPQQANEKSLALRKDLHLNLVIPKQDILITLLKSTY